MPSLARRHTLLSLPIVALLGAIIVSAALRMRLYVHYYGLTTERLYALVFMGWLAIVLALLAATVLRGRGRAFVGGSVISGLALLLGLHVVAPDVLVARVNLARAGSADATTPLDLPYLANLGGDAVPLAVRATLATPAAGARNSVDADARCAAASRLLHRWGPASPIGRAPAQGGCVAHVERRRTARDARRGCALGGASPRGACVVHLAAGRRATIERRERDADD